MFTFLIVLTVVGFIGLLISFYMLISETDPFALWATLTCTCIVMCLVGSIGAAVVTEEDKPSVEQTIQVDQVEDDYEQYNYCPYCGKEIK